MKLLHSLWIAAVVCTISFAVQPQPVQAPAVVELAEDDVEPLLAKLNNDGDGFGASQIQAESRDVFAGVASIRGTNFQRHSSRIQGWNYPIVEKPQPGQYRYLRFAWKRTEGPGIMIQLHNAINGSWNQRYYAGQASAQTAAWGPMIQVTSQTPRDWVLVTRDLFKDYGPMTVCGFAFTSMEGGGFGYFDHIYLGRTLEDLDRATAAAFGKTPRNEALTEAQLDKLWQDLASRNVTTAGQALRTLLAGRSESIRFLEQRLLPKKLAAPDDKRILSLIVSLDEDDFRTRENAFRELDKLGAKVLSNLRKARIESVSLEAQKRLDHLIRKHGGEEAMLTTDQLRLLRGIRILEWSQTPAARKVLESLDREPLEAGLNVEVKTALQRLKRNP